MINGEHIFPLVVERGFFPCFLPSSPYAFHSSFPRRHKGKFRIQITWKTFLSNFFRTAAAACILSCTHFVDKANGRSFYFGCCWSAAGVMYNIRPVSLSPCNIPFFLISIRMNYGLWPMLNAELPHPPHNWGLFVSQWGWIIAHLINMNTHRMMIREIIWGGKFQFKFASSFPYLHSASLTTRTS